MGGANGFTNQRIAKPYLFTLPAFILLTLIPTTTSTTGETLQLELLAIDTKNREHQHIPASWSSSDPRIAQINGGGLVTAVASGSAILTAAAEGKRTSLKISVVPPPLARLEIRPPTATISTGEAKQFEAIAIDVKGRER